MNLFNMNQEKEIWATITGWEGYYEVSNLGQVRSVRRVIIFKDGRIAHYKGKVLKYCISSDGYPCVGLSRGGEQLNKAVHTIVGSHFVDGYEEGLELNHKDGNKLNASASNLEWITHQKNMLHALENQLWDPGCRKMKPVINVTTGEKYKSEKEAARLTGVNAATFHSRMSSGKNKHKFNFVHA